MLKQILHVLGDKGVVLHERSRCPESVSLGEILLFALALPDSREAAGLLDNGLAIVVEHLLRHLNVDFRGGVDLCHWRTAAVTTGEEVQQQCLAGSLLYGGSCYIRP